jgi:hypothetical protein
MLLLWIFLGLWNLYYAITLAGTWMSFVSMFFVAMSIYYVIKDSRRA